MDNEAYKHFIMTKFLTILVPDTSVTFLAEKF